MGAVEAGFITYQASVGVDIGQKRDPTAIAVAELRVLEGTPVFYARHLERLPLGTDFKQVATRVAEVCEGAYGRLLEARNRESLRRQLRSVRDYDGRWDAPPPPEIYLRLDSTGLGLPVVELVRDELSHRIAHAVRVQPCFFTHGDRITKQGKQFTVGKAALVSRLQSLAYAGALKIAKDTEGAEAMLEELLDYEIRVDQNANDKYGAFRVGSHDDLVTALGLAVLKTPRGGRRQLTGMYELPPSNPEHARFT